jgi:hypothetical protein
MSFKKNWNGIPKSLISQYKTQNPYGQISMKKNILDPQQINNVMRNKKFNFHIPRGLEQPDLTAYSQGNVGSKNN